MKALKILVCGLFYLFICISAYSYCEEGAIQYRVDPDNKCGTQSRVCCGYADSYYEDGGYSIDFAPADPYFPEYGQSCCGPTECYSSSSKKCEAFVCPSGMRAPKNGYLSKDGMCSDGWDYSNCNYVCNEGYCFNSSNKVCDAKPSKQSCYAENGSCSYDCSCTSSGWSCGEKIICNSGYTLTDSPYGKKCVRNNASWACINQEGDCNEWGNGWAYEQCPLTPHDGGKCNPYNYNDAPSYKCASRTVTGYASGYSCYDCTCH